MTPGRNRLKKMKMDCLLGGPQKEVFMYGMNMTLRQHPPSILAWGLVIILLMSTGGLLSAGDDESGFKAIFNGKDLSGWDGEAGFWSVRDGAITGQSTPARPARKNTFIMWRGGLLDDFELRLSYRVVGGNSGIQYRSHEEPGWNVSGYQADIESGDRWTGVCYDEHGRAVLAGRGEKTVIQAGGARKTTRFAQAADLMKLVRKEDWNDYRITARGDHLIHAINGHVMCEVIDGEVKNRDRTGILALQIHSGPPMTVQFRNIRLKRFPLTDRKKVVLVAGGASHGKGQHAHNAGVMLLKHCLDQSDKTINAAYLNGWPKDPTAFDNADAILLFMDGGGGHPMLRAKGLPALKRCMARGAGLAVLHYALGVPPKRGGQEFLDWIGGYWEPGYSANPCWVPSFDAFPVHAVTRGLKPFSLNDEWYFNLRFRPGMSGITPLLTATPPDKVRNTKAARAHPGRREVMAWCVERPDGGRGFGFTGGHFHANWGNKSFRTLVLNAVWWTAKLEVPEKGVPAQPPADLMKVHVD